MFESNWIIVESLIYNLCTYDIVNQVPIFRISNTSRYIVFEKNNRSNDPLVRLVYRLG